MTEPTISYGDELKRLVAEGNYIGQDDQRFPYMGVAYIEWEGKRPSRCGARLSLTCHECGASMTYDQRPDFTGFWSGNVTCPSCGAAVEITCFRAWESGFRPGMFVIAMPYTTSRWATMKPIELRVLEIQPE